MNETKRAIIAVEVNLMKKGDETKKEIAAETKKANDETKKANDETKKEIIAETKKAIVAVEDNLNAKID